MSIDDPIFKMRSWIFLGNICSMGTTCKSIFGNFFFCFHFFSFPTWYIFSIFCCFFQKNPKSVLWGKPVFFNGFVFLAHFRPYIFLDFFRFFLLKNKILYYGENEVFQHVFEFCRFPTWYIFLIIFVFFSENWNSEVWGKRSFFEIFHKKKSFHEMELQCGKWHYFHVNTEKTDCQVYSQA